ncbi:MAG: hypothetical protein ACO2PL_12995 [Armatimonadota bacterium]|jgi:hypothetical protein
MATKYRKVWVAPDTFEALKGLSARLRLSIPQTIALLVRQTLESLEPRKRTNEANTTETPLGKTNADSPARQAVAETLYLTEPVIEMFEAMISVYPDLKAECSLTLERLRTRFVEVAESWGFLPASEPTGQPTEEKTEQPQ